MFSKYKVKKEIIISKKYFIFQKILPSKILNIFGYEHYIGYINDIAWINEKEFIINTREGNAILHLDTYGNFKDIIRSRKFRPTRYISSRLPGDRLILIDAYQARIMEIS